MSSLKISLKNVVMQAQHKEYCHKKLVKKIEKSFEVAHIEEFSNAFFHNLVGFYCCNSADKNPYVARGLEFLAKLAVNITLKCVKPVSTTNANGTVSQVYDIGTDPFFTNMLKCSLKFSMVEKAEVRFNTCYFVTTLLQSIGNNVEMDIILCNTILEALIDLLHDPKVNVRLQAVRALVRLQEPTNPECIVLKTFMLLSTDASSEIRKAVVKFIAPHPQSFIKIIDRLSDTDIGVRQAAYTKLADVNPRLYLKIVDRNLILTRAFADENKKINFILTEKLLPKWLNAYGGNYMDFLKALKLDADENDIKNFESLCTKVLDVYLKKNPLTDILKYLPVAKDNKLVPVKQLNIEGVLYWSRVIDFLRQKEDAESYLEDIIPELRTFSNYIEWVIKEKSASSLDEWEKLEYQNIINQLFQIASGYDMSDEVGRKTFYSLIIQILSTYKFQQKVIDRIISVAVQLSTSTEFLITDICQVISEIREPLMEEEMSEEKLRATNFEVSQLKVKIHQLEISEEEAAKSKDFHRAGIFHNEIWEYKRKLENLLNICSVTSKVKVSHDDPETLCRCLDILIGLLTKGKIRSMSDSLRSCKENFLMPLLTNNSAEVHWRFILCLGLLSLLDEETAHQHAHFICLPIATYKALPKFDKTALKISIACVTDLIRLYGVEIIGIEKNTGQDQNQTNTRRKLYSEDMEDLSVTDEENITADCIFDIILDMLDDEDEDVRDTAVTSLSRLMVQNFSINPELIHRFILKWFNPLSEKKDSKLQQKIGITIKYFAENVEGARKVIAQAVIPIITTLVNAPRTSPLIAVDIDNVIRFLSALTNTAGIDEENIHNDLALQILEKMSKTPFDTTTPHFAKLLTYLELLFEDPSPRNNLIALAELLLEEVTDRTPRRHLLKFIDKLRLDNEGRQLENITGTTHATFESTKTNDTTNVTDIMDLGERQKYWTPRRAESIVTSQNSGIHMPITKNQTLTSFATSKSIEQIAQNNTPGNSIKTRGANTSPLAKLNSSDVSENTVSQQSKAIMIPPLATPNPRSSPRVRTTPRKLLDHEQCLDKTNRTSQKHRVPLEVPKSTTSMKSPQRSTPQNDPASTRSSQRTKKIPGKVMDDGKSLSKFTDITVTKTIEVTTPLHVNRLNHTLLTRSLHNHNGFTSEVKVILQRDVASKETLKSCIQRKSARNDTLEMQKSKVNSQRSNNRNDKHPGSPFSRNDTSTTGFSQKDKRVPPSSKDQSPSQNSSHSQTSTARSAQKNKELLRIPKNHFLSQKSPQTQSFGNDTLTTRSAQKEKVLTRSATNHSPSQETFQRHTSRMDSSNTRNAQREKVLLQNSKNRSPSQKSPQRRASRIDSSKTRSAPKDKEQPHSSVNYYPSEKSPQGEISRIDSSTSGSSQKNKVLPESATNHSQSQKSPQRQASRIDSSNARSAQKDKVQPHSSINHSPSERSPQRKTSLKDTVTTRSSQKNKVQPRSSINHSQSQNSTQRQASRIDSSNALSAQKDKVQPHTSINHSPSKRSSQRETSLNDTVTTRSSQKNKVQPHSSINHSQSPKFPQRQASRIDSSNARSAQKNKVQPHSSINDSQSQNSIQRQASRIDSCNALSAQKDKVQPHTSINHSPSERSPQRETSLNDTVTTRSSQKNKVQPHSSINHSQSQKSPQRQTSRIDSSKKRSAQKDKVQPHSSINQSPLQKSPQKDTSRNCTATPRSSQKNEVLPRSATNHRPSQKSSQRKASRIDRFTTPSDEEDKILRNSKNHGSSRRSSPSLRIETPRSVPITRSFQKNNIVQQRSVTNNHSLNTLNKEYRPQRKRKSPITNELHDLIPNKIRKTSNHNDAEKIEVISMAQRTKEKDSLKSLYQSTKSEHKIGTRSQRKIKNRISFCPTKKSRERKRNELRKSIYLSPKKNAKGESLKEVLRSSGRSLRSRLSTSVPKKENSNIGALNTESNSKQKNNKKQDIPTQAKKHTTANLTANSKNSQKVLPSNKCSKCRSRVTNCVHNNLIVSTPKSSSRPIEDKSQNSSPKSRNVKLSGSSQLQNKTKANSYLVISVPKLRKSPSRKTEKTSRKKLSFSSVHNEEVTIEDATSTSNNSRDSDKENFSIDMSSSSSSHKTEYTARRRLRIKDSTSNDSDTSPKKKIKRRR